MGQKYQYWNIACIIGTILKSILKTSLNFQAFAQIFLFFYSLSFKKQLQQFLNNYDFLPHLIEQTEQENFYQSQNDIILQLTNLQEWLISIENTEKAIRLFLGLNNNNIMPKFYLNFKTRLHNNIESIRKQTLFTQFPLNKEMVLASLNTNNLVIRAEIDAFNQLDTNNIYVDIFRNWSQLEERNRLRGHALYFFSLKISSSNIERSFSLMNNLLDILSVNYTDDSIRLRLFALFNYNLV